jgi:hypothetical protein
VLTDITTYDGASPVGAISFEKYEFKPISQHAK